MGWWSHKIMGGDTPLDVLSVLAAEVGAPFVHEDDGRPTWHCYAWPALDEARVARLAALLYDREHEYRYGHRSITAQVLAVLLMRSGTPIREGLRAQLTELIGQDEWAYEPGEDDRRQEIDGLLRALRAYTGTPVDYDTDDGLLSALGKENA